MRLLLMADRQVGKEITHWLLSEYPDDVAFVVTTDRNEILEAVNQANIPGTVFRNTEQVCDEIEESGIEFDLGALTWWPKIIEPALMNKPKWGFINTHPSLLPYNRGKHYNFWALVEQAPFGVSIHMADEGIDSGDIIAQSPIEYGWEDTGETLYYKAQKAIIELFKETYPSIRELNFNRTKQNHEQGSFHEGKELDDASRINLDQKYTARQLLNKLRARTFSGYPACWFTEDGNTYEVRIEIKKKDD